MWFGGLPCVGLVCPSLDLGGCSRVGLGDVPVGVRVLGGVHIWVVPVWVGGVPVWVGGCWPSPCGWGPPLCWSGVSQFGSGGLSLFGLGVSPCGSWGAVPVWGGGIPIWVWALSPFGSSPFGSRGLSPCGLGVSLCGFGGGAVPIWVWGCPCAHLPAPPQIMHGGLFSEDGVTLDDIRKIERNRQPPDSGGTRGLAGGCPLCPPTPQPLWGFGGVSLTLHPPCRSHVRPAVVGPAAAGESIPTLQPRGSVPPK